MKMAIGILLAASIGATCRIFDLPVPAPPKLLGAALVAAMTLGYMLADQYMTAKTAKTDPPKIEQSASK